MRLLDYLLYRLGAYHCKKGFDPLLTYYAYYQGYGDQYEAEQRQGVWM